MGTQTNASENIISNTLYIGELSPVVNETHLSALFNSVGPIKSIHVSRDHGTGCSLGFGYVTFVFEADAKKALDSLNFTSLYGQEIRLVFFHKNKAQLHNMAANLFVRNLDEQVDNKLLRLLFEEFGQVLSSKIMCGENGEPLGRGFVQYGCEESAEKAKSHMNGKMIKGKSIQVSSFLPRSQRFDTGGCTNLYVKNFPLDYKPEDLFEKFSPYGEITSFAFPTKEDLKPKGFAFVNFAEPDSANRALEDLNAKPPLYFYVAKGEPRLTRREKLQRQFHACSQSSDDVAGRCVYLRNFPREFNESDLLSKLSPFGDIQSISIQRKPAGSVREFGYVIFKESSAVPPVIAAVNGTSWGGKKIFASLWEPKSVRSSWKHASALQKNLRNLSQTTEVNDGFFAIDKSQGESYLPLHPNSRQFYFPVVVQPAAEEDANFELEVKEEIWKRVLEKEGERGQEIAAYINTTNVEFLQKMLESPAVLQQAIDTVKENMCLQREITEDLEPCECLAAKSQWEVSPAISSIAREGENHKINE